MSKGFINAISGYPLGGDNAQVNVPLSDSNLGFPIKMDLADGQPKENPIIENLCYNYGNGKPPLWYIKQRTLYIYEFPSNYNPYSLPSSGYLFDSGITWDELGRIISYGGIYKRSTVVQEPKLTQDGADIEIGKIVVDNGKVKEYYSCNTINPYLLFYKKVETIRRNYSSGTLNLGKFDESQADNTSFSEENNDHPYITLAPQPAMWIDGSFTSSPTVKPSSQGWIKPYSATHIKVIERHLFFIDKGQEIRFFFGRKSNVASGNGYLGVWISTWAIEHNIEGDVLTCQYRYLNPSTLVADGAWQTLPYRAPGYLYTGSRAMYGTVLQTGLEKYLEIRIVGANTEMLSRAGILFKYTLEAVT